MKTTSDPNVTEQSQRVARGSLRRMLNCEKSFRVIYNDGYRTRRVSHLEASNLKAIYGGQVVFDPWKAS